MRPKDATARSCGYPTPAMAAPSSAAWSAARAAVAPERRNERGFAARRTAHACDAVKDKIQAASCGAAPVWASHQLGDIPPFRGRPSQPASFHARQSHQLAEKGTIGCHSCVGRIGRPPGNKCADKAGAELAFQAPGSGTSSTGRKAKQGKNKAFPGGACWPLVSAQRQGWQRA